MAIALRSCDAVCTVFIRPASSCKAEARTKGSRFCHNIGNQLNERPSSCQNTIHDCNDITIIHLCRTCVETLLNRGYILTFLLKFTCIWCNKWLRHIIEFLVIDKPMKLTVPAPWKDTIGSMSVLQRDNSKFLWFPHSHCPIKYVKHVSNQSRYAITNKKGKKRLWH